MLPAISIIVPLAPNENQWQELLPALLDLNVKKEIFLVCSSKQQAQQINTLIEKYNNVCVLISGVSGRAKLMNYAAQSATGDYLWFVHADTGLPMQCADFIAKAMAANDNALYYFDLAFDADGPRLMPFNALGVYLRSHWLKLPFGDQAFLIKKKLFQQLGQYNEQAQYGEDHLLVWQAHHQGVPVKSIGGKLLSSARKYQAQGWLKTTGLHLFLTYKQALPQFYHLIKKAAKK